jgi:hypothetical protein
MSKIPRPVGAVLQAQVNDLAVAMPTGPRNSQFALLHSAPERRTPMCPRR